MCCTERKERADQQVQGHGLISGFNLGHATLTGFEQLSELDLGQVLPLPKLANCIAELQPELHIGDFLRRKSEELLSRSDSPSMCLQTSFLLLIHSYNSLAKLV